MIVLKRYYSIHADEARTESWHVDICEQPTLDVVKHWLFHRVIDKTLSPFARLIDRVNESRFVPTEDDPDDWALPLDVKIDLWCYTLGEKNKKVVSTLALNEATYEAMADVE